MKVQICTKELLKPRKQGHLYLDLGILYLWGSHWAKTIRSDPRQLPKEYNSCSILKTLFSFCGLNSHSWALPPFYHIHLPPRIRKQEAPQDSEKQLLYHQQQHSNNHSSGPRAPPCSAGCHCCSPGENQLTGQNQLTGSHFSSPVLMFLHPWRLTTLPSQLD